MVPIVWKSYFPLHWTTWFSFYGRVISLTVDNMVLIVWKSYFPYSGQHGSHSMEELFPFALGNMVPLYGRVIFL
jgi:hypothetical protein